MEKVIPTQEQYQALSDALDRAVSLRESGEGGGHGLLIHLLNSLGYYPSSSLSAERVAAKVLEQAGR